MFHITILNDEAAQMLRKCGLKFSQIRRAGKYISVISADTQAKVIKLMRDALEEAVKCSITYEDVIKYSYYASCHYFVDGGGAIRPNGVNADGGNWKALSKRGKSASWRAVDDDWVVGFSAYVAKKITYTATDGSTKVEYRVGPNDIIQTPVAAKLNSFVHVPVNDNDYELPYCDDTAMFFCSLMASLCEVDRRISEFFEKPESVLEAVTGHKTLPFGGLSLSS